MMYAITYKGNPAALEKLCTVENQEYKLSSYHNEELSMFITGRAKSICIRNYLYYFGFTWAERTKGVEASKMVVQS